MKNGIKRITILVLMVLIILLLPSCSSSSSYDGYDSDYEDEYDEEYEEEYEEEYDEEYDYEEEYYEEYDGLTDNGITNDEIWYYLDQIGYYYGTDDPFSVDDYVGEDYIDTADGESWATDIWWVDSSAFDQIGYNFHLNILDVQFDSTGWYRYYDIEPEIFVQFITSDSKGGFYNEYIKGRYECDRLS